MRSRHLCSCNAVISTDLYQAEAGNSQNAEPLQQRTAWRLRYITKQTRAMRYSVCRNLSCAREAGQRARDPDEYRHRSVGRTGT